MKRLRFGLLGHPIGHSISPVMCAEAFSALGMPHIYNAFDLPTLADLRRAVDDLRDGVLAGANVTVPHKRAVLDLVDELSPSVEEVGAANVLVVGPGRRIIAHNTDLDALVAELRELWGGRPLLRAVVVGGGGAGLAAMAACKRLGFPVIC